MRLLVISEQSRIADSLRVLVGPANYEVAHARTIELAVRDCSPSSAHAVFVQSEVADARVADNVSRLVNLGYRPVYVVVNEESADWEERVFLAGAAFVFRLPWRANLLFSRLGAILPHPPGGVATFSPDAPPQRGSRNPFGGADTGPAPTNPLLAQLGGVARLYRHASKPEAFAEAFLDQIREALALNRVALYLAQEGPGRALECAYAAGIEPKRWKQATLSLNSGMGRWMAEHLVAVSAGTVERYGLDPAIRQEMLGLGAQCAIPVQGGDEFIGVLLVGSRVTGFPLTNDEIELVYLLALELGRTLKAARLNKALAQERQFLADLTEGLGSGCAVFGAHQEVLHVNRRLVQVCGATTQQEFSFRSLPKAIASLAFEVSAGTRTDAETVYVDEKGGTHLAKVALFNPQSRAVLVLVDDVSTLTARHSGELVNRERELVTRLGSQFVHEIRNSLTQLGTLGQMLPEQRKNPAFLDQLEKALPKDLNRVLRHASNFEILSKPTPSLRKPMPIRWVLLGCWREVQSGYPHFSPSWLDAEEVTETEEVLANPEIFGRACFELLLNAAQAVEDAKIKKITVRVESSPGFDTQIIFEDSGPGMTPEAFALALSPFVTTRNQGLGLGLTLVEKFARESGGSISVEKSRLLGGAAVILTLPQT